MTQFVAFLKQKSIIKLGQTGLLSIKYPSNQKRNLANIMRQSNQAAHIGWSIESSNSFKRNYSNPSFNHFIGIRKNKKEDLICFVTFIWYLVWIIYTSTLLLEVTCFPV